MGIHINCYLFFRDIVKASHLKPIEKSDISELNNYQKGCIWNSFVDEKPSSLHNMEVLKYTIILHFITFH